MNYLCFVQSASHVTANVKSADDVQFVRELMGWMAPGRDVHLCRFPCLPQAEIRMPTGNDGVGEETSSMPEAE